MCLNLFLGTVQFSVHLFVIAMLVHYCCIYCFAFKFWYVVEQISIPYSLSESSGTFTLSYEFYNDTD